MPITSKGKKAMKKRRKKLEKEKIEEKEGRCYKKMEINSTFK